MPPLSAVERFLERLVERPAARLFGAPVQPVQVLRRIERAMESGATRRGGRLVAPDRFAVRIHPRDLARLRGADDVAADLASGALAFARRHGLALGDRPRVRIQGDPGVERGAIEVDATFGPEPGAAAVAATATRVYAVPAPAPTSWSLAIREPGREARTVVVGDRPITLGRGEDADIRLRDREVSRRHAVIQPRDGLLVLADLRSTNGTWVGGERVQEVALGVGDRIDLGGTSLVVLGDLGDAGDAMGPDRAGRATWDRTGA